MYYYTKKLSQHKNLNYYIDEDYILCLNLLIKIERVRFRLRLMIV